MKDAVRDPERLRTLRSTGLLDSEPDPAYDRWTSFVQRVLGADVSLMTLLDGSRQFFKSSAGLAEPWRSRRETPLTHSLCKHVVARGAVVRTEDAREDPELSDNRAIPELGVIAYLGVPLRGRDGRVLGALSAIQGEPRAWSERDLEILTDAAAAVETCISLTTLQRRSDAVLDSLSDLVWIVDAETTRVRYRSPSVIQLIGPGKSDVEAEWPSLAHPEDRPKLEAGLAALRSGDADVTEVGFRTVGGSEGRRSLEARLTNRTEDPALDGILVVARDVTDRKMAESKLAVLLENAPVGLWTVDRDLIFTWTGGGATADLGLGDVEFVGRSVPEILGTDDRDHPPLAAYHEALAGSPSRFDLDWGGRTWGVRLGPLVVDESIIGVVGVALDVTEHRETERRLAERTIHLQRLFDEAPEAIILVDRHDRILQVNPEFERLFGYTADEVEGRPVNELIVPSGSESEAAELTRRVASGERIEVEARRRRKDGAVIDVSILATPVEVGDQRRVYGIYRDITERKLLETQLLHSQRMEAVGQLAGGVAHDFNNLLTAILGNVQFLLEKVDDEEIREDLDEITKAGQRGARLTRQLLTFGRRDLATPEPLQVNNVIRNIRDLLDRLIEESVELEFDLHEELPEVVMDAGQLEQVVMNLVINARDAMPGGGRITVRTSLRGATESERHLMATRDAVVLAVQDEGRGMTPEERARMFEPFFTTKRPGEGTGLGLSTVYGIVERSGGTIEVTSTPGAGTTLEVLLPPSPASGTAAAAEAVLEPAAGDGSGELILLVDDDRSVRTVTRKVLELAGYEVVEAASGDEALLACDRLSRAPAAVLTDVLMPGLSGYELVERLRGRYPEIAVLLMSGYSEMDMEDATRGHGLLTKPFDPMTLVRRVRERLAEPGMGAGA